jgi:Raf kinase inhibitor-like YbhB/YbcL family protein
VDFDPAGNFLAFEPFVDGFIQPLPSGDFGFFGRPVGVGVATDGAMLLTDDTNGMLYRVSYGGASATPSPQQPAFDLFDVPAILEIRSAAFPPGGSIPERHSAYGQGVSPPLAWQGAPEGTQSLVLMMEDPDAIAPLPFVHWTVINLDPTLHALREGVRKVYEPFAGRAARQGSNSLSEAGYFGPRPPVGDPPHPYRFQLFALDVVLDLPDGFNRHALLEAMKGHVLAKGELVGTFSKPQ